MSELSRLWNEGNLDELLSILEDRYPDAPENTLAAVLFSFSLKGEPFEALEPKLDELVETLKAEWSARGW